jgi:hypothetical protein
MLMAGDGTTGGVLYACNGVSVATARALERLGLVEFTHRNLTPVTRPGGRIHYVRDWGIRLRNIPCFNEETSKK